MPSAWTVEKIHGIRLGGNRRGLSHATLSRWLRSRQEAVVAWTECGFNFAAAGRKLGRSGQSVRSSVRAWFRGLDTMAAATAEIEERQRLRRVMRANRQWDRRQRARVEREKHSSKE
jgi:hypothetical protein